MKTKEEILDSRNPQQAGEKYEDFRKTMLMCMEEYADQFRQPIVMQSLPADSELEDWVMDGYPMTEKNIERMKAAKCVRDRIKQRFADNREKLAGNGA